MGPEALRIGASGDLRSHGGGNPLTRTRLIRVGQKEAGGQ